MRVQGPVPTAVPPCASSYRCGNADFDVANALVKLRDVTGELLAERERRRVLQVRAADLDDVGERAALCRRAYRAVSSKRARDV